MTGDEHHISEARDQRLQISFRFKSVPLCLRGRIRDGISMNRWINQHQEQRNDMR